MKSNHTIKNVERAGRRACNGIEMRYAWLVLTIFAIGYAAPAVLAQDDEDASAVFGDQAGEDVNDFDGTGFGGLLTDGDGSGDSSGDVNDDSSDDDVGSPPFGPAGRAPIIQQEVQELPEAPAIPDSVNGDYADDSSSDALEFELITERYPNGEPKIRRQVTQDKDENFINHGSWEMLDEEGNVVIRGSYQFGKRDGEWTRIVSKSDAKFLSSAPYNQYNTQYLKSSATFSVGKLDGQWTIQDDRDRTISQWQFANGRRDGKSVWYYPTGDPMRVINYHAGELNGELLEYDDQRNLVTEVEYLNGRRLEKTTKYFSEDSEQKQIEGMTLRARLTLKKPDDWWKLQLASYTREGKDEKHGKWTAWYPNGEKRMEGEFQYDQPSGSFTWWHKNGQKSLEAMYSAGKKEGLWTWWHENGLRSIRGSYLNGSPANRWTWWLETGKVSHRIDYTVGSVQPVNTAPSQEATSSTVGDSILLRSPQN